MVSSSSIFTLHGFGLNPGDQVEATFHFHATEGTSRTAGASAQIVDDNGSVHFGISTHGLTQGEEGTVDAWVRALGSGVNGSPLFDSDGNPVKVTAVPIP